MSYGLTMDPDIEIAKTGIPVACTLTTKEAAGQTLEWSDLQARATRIAPLDRGARMTFSASVLDDVEDLIRRERACCAFLTLDTSLNGNLLTLDITSESPDGLAVIQSLAGVTRR